MVAGRVEKWVSKLMAERPSQLDHGFMPNVRPEDPPQRSGTSGSPSETGPVWPLDAGDEAELLVGKSEIPGSRSVRSNSETPGSRPQALGKTDLMTEALSRWVSEGGAPLRVKG